MKIKDLAIILLHQLALGNTILVTKKYLDFCINKVLSILADIDNYHTLFGYIGFMFHRWLEENISLHKNNVKWILETKYCTR